MVSLHSMVVLAHAAAIFSVGSPIIILPNCIFKFDELQVKTGGHKFKSRIFRIHHLAPNGTFVGWTELETMPFEIATRL